MRITSLPIEKAPARRDIGQVFRRISVRESTRSTSWKSVLSSAQHQVLDSFETFLAALKKLQVKSEPARDALGSIGQSSASSTTTSIDATASSSTKYATTKTLDRFTVSTNTPTPTAFSQVLQETALPGTAPSSGEKINFIPSAGTNINGTGTLAPNPHITDTLADSIASSRVPSWKVLLGAVGMTLLMILSATNL